MNAVSTKARSSRGYATLDDDKQTGLKKQKLQAPTILSGGKIDCDEFGPFGDVVELEDITP